MVSEMDRGAEQLIVDAVLAARPDDSIMGEEGTAREGTSGVRWIIDPLDGTTNYLYGLPAWSVSIGVEVDGELYVGVVDAPVLHQQYWSLAGAGAWLGEERLQASVVTDLRSALVATGFSYSADQRAEQGRLVAQLLPRIRDIRRGGSAALDLCWAASGRVDAYYESGCEWWDVAAGTLIGREAGAVVTHSNAKSPGRCVAAPPSLHEALTVALAAASAACAS